MEQTIIGIAALGIILLAAAGVILATPGDDL